MSRFSLVIAFSLVGLPLAAQQPKAIEEATKLLEKALADSKDAAEQAQLRQGIDALKKIGVELKTQNSLISDFIDNTDNYKGKDLTFGMHYDNESDEKEMPLRNRVGDKYGLTLFTGQDSKNGAKIKIMLSIPTGLVVPDAKRGDPVVVTFKCGEGSITKGNSVIEIRRPLAGELRRR